MIPHDGGAIDDPPRTRIPDPIDTATGGQRRLWGLVVLLAIAAGVRFWGIERASLWYDELVPYRVAATATTSDALKLLHETDATAAPLHPLLLQGWFRVFGVSEGSGRGLSALCGVGVVAAVFLLGRKLFEERSAWLAAMLATVSPPLVYYSRELRMYALLVLIACLGWLAVGMPGRWGWRRGAAYLAAMVALGYAHPLGGLMIATLALFTWVDRPVNGLSWIRWMLVHMAVGLLLIPALVGYINHAPTYDEPSGRSLRLLLGFPIGYIGGNFLVLAACLAIILFGILRQPRMPRSVRLLLLWLLGPVVLLYGASWIGRPLFGPARYTLFVAPAYLLLLGHGLARMPRWPRAVAVIGLLACTIHGLWTTVYAEGLKADWRGASELIGSVEGAGKTVNVAIAVVDPRYVGELEVARHYLGTRADVRVVDGVWPDARGGWLAVGLRDGQPAAALPLDVGVPTVVVEVHRRPGMLLMRAAER